MGSGPRSTQSSLVSRTVRDLVAGYGIRCGDRGEHDVHGVPDRWQLRELAGETADSTILTGALYPDMRCAPPSGPTCTPGLASVGAVPLVVDDAVVGRGRKFGGLDGRQSAGCGFKPTSCSCVARLSVAFGGAGGGALVVLELGGGMSASLRAAARAVDRRVARRRARREGSLGEAVDLASLLAASVTNGAVASILGRDEDPPPIG